MESKTTTALAPAAAKLPAVERALDEVLRGKPEVVRLSLVCLLARGHLLIEDVPGVGKTTLGQALAHIADCRFQRIQLTADMLPSDVLGVTVFNALTHEFEFKPGPIFTNFLLADEINRTSPKTQSALLEAMNEQQVTVDGVSRPLDAPFMVIATQNPIEHHGTYPLPESQLDRFLMRIDVGYPDTESERQILRQSSGGGARLARPLLTAGEVLALQEQVGTVAVDRAVEDYLLAIVDRTRHNESLSLGVSPRGAQALYRAAQAYAIVDGRDYVLPDDVKRLAAPVFAHRVAMNSRAALGQRGSNAAHRVIQDILKLVDVPL